jgi:hypothetical protein
MPLSVDILNANSILLNGSPILNLYKTGSGYNSTLRSGVNNEANGCYSVVSGGRCNTTQTRYSTISGGRRNDAGVIGAISSWNDSYSGSLNTGGPFGPYSPTSASTISGYGAEFEFSFFGGGSYDVNLINGGSGYADGDVLVFNGNLFPSGTTSADTVTLSNIYVSNYGYATVGGGRENTASGEYSTISGGYENTASGYASFIGGGENNTASACYSTIGGGENSTITTNSDYSTISGGEDHLIDGQDSTIGGGENNTIIGQYSTVSGGYCNTIQSNYSTISGGYNNTSSGDYSFVGGGSGNTVNNQYGGILGGSGNTVNHDASFIVGSGISSTANNTLHINCLHFSNIPTSSAGLAPGTVWNDTGTLKIA